MGRNARDPDHAAGKNHSRRNQRARDYYNPKGLRHAESHFDPGALCAQVLEQDLGLQISTNNPGSFRRILYKHMRAHPEHKLHIYQDPSSASRFLLLRSALAPTMESPDVQD